MSDIEVVVNDTVVPTDSDSFYFDIDDPVIVPGLKDLDGNSVLNTVIHARLQCHDTGENLYLVWTPDHYRMYFGWFTEDQIVEEIE